MKAITLWNEKSLLMYILHQEGIFNSIMGKTQEV